MVLVTLNLTQEIYGTNLPESICQQIKSKPIIAQLSSQIKQQLLSPTTKSKDIFPLTSLYFQTIESWQDRLTMILTPKPLEWRLIHLPAILFPLYYPIRIFRLSWKYLNKLIRS